MPKASQLQLYARLARNYRTTSIWKEYAEGRSFSEMGQHEAAHFLCFLLFRLKAIAIPGLCYCGQPFDALLEPKNPAVRPGSRDGSAR
jgi:hypothetical protein